MTDNEIIRAYEICNNSCSCAGCPLEFAGGGCGKILKNKVLDLIMRQQTEIKRLNNNMDVMVKEHNNLIKTYKECMSDIIKEFADKLKEEFMVNTDNNGDINSCYVSNIIDNLIKEMV